MYCRKKHVKGKLTSKCYSIQLFNKFLIKNCRQTFAVLIYICITIIISVPC